MIRLAQKDGDRQCFGSIHIYFHDPNVFTDGLYFKIKQIPDSFQKLLDLDPLLERSDLWFITRFSCPGITVLSCSLYLDQTFVRPRQIIFIYLSGLEKSYASPSVICLGKCI